MEARNGFKDIQFMESDFGFKVRVWVGIWFSSKDIQFMGSGFGFMVWASRFRLVFGI